MAPHPSRGREAEVLPFLSPPSTLRSRPPAGGASPLTHTCIYSREMLHASRPAGAQAGGPRLRMCPCCLRHQPRVWRPLVDSCRGSLPFVCPPLSERVLAPKEAGQCWGLGGLDEADVREIIVCPASQIEPRHPQHMEQKRPCAPPGPEAVSVLKESRPGTPGRRQPPCGLQHGHAAAEATAGIPGDGLRAA